MVGDRPRDALKAAHFHGFSLEEAEGEGFEPSIRLRRTRRRPVSAYELETAVRASMKRLKELGESYHRYLATRS